MQALRYLTAAQRDALGCVVAESAAIEASVDTWLLHVSGLRSAHYALLTSGRMLSWKLSALKEIGVSRLRSQNRRRRFGALIDLLSSLNGERNIAVHGTWRPRGGHTLATLFYPERWGPGEAVQARNGATIRAERLAPLAQAMESRCAELDRLCNEFWVSPAVRRYMTRQRRAEARFR